MKLYKRPTNKTLAQCNSETWWRRITATLLDVSLGTYRRRRRDVLMARLGYVPLRRLGDVPLRRRLLFHLRFVREVVETYWCYVLLRRCHKVPIRSRGDVPLRRLGDFPPRHRWVFHSRRTCDVVGTYRQTSWRP